MESCDCIEPLWQDELLKKWQFVFDVIIAMAFFSIPFELIYSAMKSVIFPYRCVFIQFCAFIVVCGATHLTNYWAFTMQSKTVAIAMTIAKISSAVVSCVTAMMLVHVIPDLLSMKKREMFLKNRVEELDREKGRILTQVETGRHARVLTHEIRSTLDRQTILRTTLLELGRIFELEECTLWMPSPTGITMRIFLSLNHPTTVGSAMSMKHPSIAEIINNSGAVRIHHTSPLARARQTAGRDVTPDVVAIRVPLLQTNDCSDVSAKNYAVLVLVSASDSARKFREHELELVEIVANQVAVALSHAATLEESMRACDQLIKQNAALELACGEAEIEIRSHNDFLFAMNHEMRNIMQAIIASSSILLGTNLTPEQREMLETILKSGNQLSASISDVLDLSKLEDGSLELEISRFNLRRAFREVIQMIMPVASVKKLPLTFGLSPEVPIGAFGDENRLMQVMLHVVGNAVKFTKAGYVSVSASIATPESLRNWRTSEFYPVLVEGHFYLMVQVKDSGCGIIPQDIPMLFTKFTQLNPTGGGLGIGLAICKRILNLMGGQIWIESEGPGKGTVATFVVKLGTCDNPSDVISR